VESSSLHGLHRSITHASYTEEHGGEEASLETHRKNCLDRMTIVGQHVVVESFIGKAGLFQVTPNARHLSLNLELLGDWQVLVLVHNRFLSADHDRKYTEPEDQSGGSYRLYPREITTDMKDLHQ